ncbi:hypothetical protein ACOSP7_003720 [Xanthoceras sorbifolium]
MRRGGRENFWKRRKKRTGKKKEPVNVALFFATCLDSIGACEKVTALYVGFGYIVFENQRRFSGIRVVESIGPQVLVPRAHNSYPRTPGSRAAYSPTLVLQLLTLYTCVLCGSTSASTVVIIPTCYVAVNREREIE